jgi:N-acetylmuramoyl-L-alanine amidase
MVKLLNVRSGPGTAYPIIAIVKEGDELTALGRTGDNLWIVVGMADGKSGWCSAYSKYVTLDVDVSQLPIAPIPAPPKAAAPTAARTPTP